MQLLFAENARERRLIYDATLEQGDLIDCNLRKGSPRLQSCEDFNQSNVLFEAQLLYSVFTPSMLHNSTQLVHQGLQKVCKAPHDDNLLAAANLPVWQSCKACKEAVVTQDTCCPPGHWQPAACQTLDSSRRGQ